MRPGSSVTSASPSGVNERLRGFVSPSATGTSRTRNSSPGGHWPCAWPFGEHEPGTHVSNTSGSGAAGGGAVLATAVGSVACMQPPVSTRPSTKPQRTNVLIGFLMIDS